MFGNLAVNRVLVSYIAAGLFFYILQLTVDPTDLIILLNGLFVGSIVAIGVSYHELIIGAIKGQGEYTNIRHMTLGFFTMWVAILLMIYPSIELRMLGAPLPGTSAVPVISAFGKFLAIGAAILQVTAPDFGLGIFYGRDRRVLWSGLLLGSVIAGFLMILQKTEVMA